MPDEAGDPSNQMRLSAVTFTSGAALQLNNHLSVIVGPNNVGKSVLLNSVWSQLQRAPHSPSNAPMPPIAAIDCSPPSADRMRARLDSETTRQEAGSNPQFAETTWAISHTGQTVPESWVQIMANVDPTGPKLAPILPLFAAHLQPEARLQQLASVATPNLLVERPSQPLQKMFSNRELEQKLADYAKRAFDIDVSVNRFAGSQISLHVGRPSSVEPRPGEVTPYLSEIGTMPLVNAQGHGVQAFLGIVMTLLGQQYDLLLVDEPEAFLHPPQARLLGEIFVELSNAGMQIVVSTHSNDFLLGVLNASGADSDVTVARLTRPTTTTNAIAQLEPDDLRSLYNDPLLRYSSILSGVFYKGVVLCESEADCRFYGATIDVLADLGERRPDLLFTHCSGKDRMARCVRALQAIKVPTAVIADIDLLADQAKFTELFTLCGGDASALQGRLNELQNFVESLDERVRRDLAKQSITGIFDGSSEPEVSNADLARIREVISKRSGWRQIKKNGRGAVAHGTPRAAFEAVLSAAAAVGLFLVPVGELEGFHPTIVGNKQAWIRLVFENGTYKQESEAWSFLRDVSGYIAREQ